MSVYRYEALDASGRLLRGRLEAASEQDGVAQLKGRSLTPVRLVARAPAKGPGLLGQGLSRRLPVATLALVTRQLATLIAVTPLDQALRTLAAQAEREALRTLLMSVHASVLEGRRLSEAMGRERGAFPALYRAMVAAGESSGALAPTLERLADILEREQETRVRVMTAVAYPAVLAFTALAVIAALMAFVVPRVVEQFDSMGQELPLLTRAIIGLSQAIRLFGPLGLVLLVLGGGVAAALLRRPQARLRFDAFLLRTPLIGRLLRDLHAARLARTLSTMIGGGLPVLEGLLITAPTVSNHALRRATEQMAVAIGEGASLSAAMRRAEVFPPLLVHMTASGEAAGRVELMLASAAEYLEREFGAVMSVALSLLEPAIILVMGLMVALIVLAILLPILQINTLSLA